MLDTKREAEKLIKNFIMPSTNRFNEIEEAEKIIETLKEWFKDVIRKEDSKPGPPIKILIGTDNKYYFQGNKTYGSDYERNTWSKVPILELAVRQFADETYYVHCHLSYTPWGSANYLQGEEHFKEKVIDSIERCKEDFLTQYL